MRWIALVLGLLTLGGCAHYEFDLVEPKDLARHIGAKQEQVVAVEPLTYHLQAAENRLVMRIYNSTDEPVELVGSSSYVVDPKGQSHPLRTQTMAPHSFIKLILPPMRPVYRAGPSFGVGVGVSSLEFDNYEPSPLWYSRSYYPTYWHPYHYYEPFYDPFYDRPMYFQVYDESDSYYWEWTDQGTIRMRLNYRQAEKTFSQEFVFHRVKM